MRASRRLLYHRTDVRESLPPLSTGQRILIDSSAGSSRPRTLQPDTGVAWRWIGWFALVLTVAGVADWVLAWIPLRLGSPEWEFGTVTASFGGLPLVTMGFAGLLGSAFARGKRWQIIATGWIVLFFALLIVGALLLFILDVPIALRVVQGPARLGILKATAKTVMLGVLFSTAYFIASIGALRYAYPRKGR